MLTAKEDHGYVYIWWYCINAFSDSFEEIHMFTVQVQYFSELCTKVILKCYTKNAKQYYF